MKIKHENYFIELLFFLIFGSPARAKGTHYLYKYFSYVFNNVQVNACSKQSL